MEIYTQNFFLKQTNRKTTLHRKPTCNYIQPSERGRHKVLFNTKAEFPL